MYVFSFLSDHRNRGEEWQSLCPREEYKLVSCIFPLLLGKLDFFLWLHDHVVSGHARDFVDLRTNRSALEILQHVLILFLWLLIRFLRLHHSRDVWDCSCLVF